MKSGIWAISTVLLVPFLLSCASPAEKAIVVTAEKTGAGDGPQQLWLRGVKSSGASGIRVYVSPSATGKTDPSEGSRVGTLFFSHHADNQENGETFVVPLTSLVTGQAKVVIVPIASNKRKDPGPVELKSAEIKNAAR